MRIIIVLLFVISSLVSLGQINENLEYGKFRENPKTLKKPSSSAKMDNYDVVYYGLNLEATNTNSTISLGLVTIKAKVVDSPMSEFVIQLIDQLIVSRVKLNGVTVLFTHQSDEISLSCPSAIAVGELFTVEVQYAGTPQGDGWQCTNSGWGGLQVTWTLSESFHAYEWFPVKQSLTDKADSVDVYVTVPSNLKVASNGLLKKTTIISGDI